MGWTRHHSKTAFQDFIRRLDPQALVQTETLGGGVEKPKAGETAAPALFSRPKEHACRSPLSALGGRLFRIDSTRDLEALSHDHPPASRRSARSVPLYRFGG